MALPFFYISDYIPGQSQVELAEEASRHVVHVLRMKVGEQINLTDGKGALLTCTIAETGKKSCTVEVREIKNQKPKTRNISVGISLIKNTNRFEWFLEKATEIGVTEIIPLVCARTEKEKFRSDRLKGICISAMLQSQQCRLPVLHEPVDFDKIISTMSSEQKFIAHCDDENNKQPLTHQLVSQLTSKIILIGPEGDFTSDEISLAVQNGFSPVSLGDTRLRTETAGVVAATLLCIS